MDVAKDRLASNAGFAVRRSFAPTRIERELLAQVFEIVHHRPMLDVAKANRAPSASPEAPKNAIEHYLCEPSLDPSRFVREAAA